MLEKALILAAKAHTGQVDKGGAPYILHPIRVMLACEGEKEKIVALLHDTLEDTRFDRGRPAACGLSGGNRAGGVLPDAWAKGGLHGLYCAHLRKCAGGESEVCRFAG